jgi:hypothetical protein
MVEDDDLRAVFFDPDDFAEEVTVKPPTGDPYTVMAIFDTRPVINPVALAKAQVGFKDGMSNNGNSPQFRCRTSDVPNLKSGPGTLVEARGRDYAVWDVQPDGTGMSLIILKVA